MQDQCPRLEIVAVAVPVAEVDQESLEACFETAYGFVGSCSSGVMTHTDRMIGSCMPRIPADRFQVTKETSNKGRWCEYMISVVGDVDSRTAVYTCQRSRSDKSDGCGFFLWAEDAEGRMKAVVLSNSTSEPGVRCAEQLAAKSPLRSQTESISTVAYSSDGSGGASARASPRRKLPWLNMSSSSSSHGKRKASDYTSDQDTSDDSFEAALTSAVDKATFCLTKTLPAILPSTPGKAQKQTPFTTPRQMTSTHGLATPNTTSTRHILDYNLPCPDMPSTKTTPTPTSRFRNALTPTPDSPSKNLRALLDPALPNLANSSRNHDRDMGTDTSTTLRILRAEIARLVPCVHGLEKGRDVARAAVRARDAEIEVLKRRVRGLEEERERRWGTGVG